MSDSKIEIDDDVHVYRMDGSDWFDGTVHDILRSGNLVIRDGEGDLIEVNPDKTKVEKA
jgi:biotin-(acetyl-CoA carboxylase) ligase